MCLLLLGYNILQAAGQHILPPQPVCFSLDILTGLKRIDVFLGDESGLGLGVGL